MEVNPQFKKCFISSSAKADVDALVNLLKDRNVNAINMGNLFSNECISSFAENEILNSDFVCAILENNSPNVFFEIGVARGAKKPVFLIINYEQAVPYCLKDVTYVRASIKDINRIKYSLDQFLSHYRPPKQVDASSYRGKTLDNEFITNCRLSIDNASSGLEIESLVANIFEHLDDIIIVKKHENNKGVDFSIWADELDNIVGNPILVEVKSGNLSDSQLLKAEKKLRNLINKTKAPLGMLLYHDKKNRSFRPQEVVYPLVIWLDLRDLLSSLHEKSLAQIIIDKTNQAPNNTIEG